MGDVNISIMHFESCDNDHKSDQHKGLARVLQIVYEPFSL